jgi:hypothetical protein
MDPDPALFPLLAVPALLAVNALFAAAESALLTHRGTPSGPEDSRPGRPGRVYPLALAAHLARSAASVLLGVVLAKDLLGRAEDRAGAPHASLRGGLNLPIPKGASASAAGALPSTASPISSAVTGARRIPFR